MSEGTNALPHVIERAEARGWKCPNCGNGGVYITCDCGWIDAEELDTAASVSPKQET